MLSPISPTLSSLPLAPTRLELDQSSFAQVMNTAQREVDTRAAERALQQPTDKTRKAAQDFVAIAFVQPVLKQLRESNQAAAPFGPSSAQKSFQQMLDGVLSRKITQGSNWPLVDAIANRMTNRGGSPAVTPSTPALPLIQANSPSPLSVVD